MSLETEALAYYRVLSAASQLDQVLLVEFRCPNGCLLAHMFNTPAGVATYHPVTHAAAKRNGMLNIGARTTGGYVRSVIAKATVDGKILWDIRGDGHLQGGQSFELVGECRHNSRWICSGYTDMLEVPGKTTRVIASTHN